MSAYRLDDSDKGQITRRFYEVLRFRTEASRYQYDGPVEDLYWKFLQPETADRLRKIVREVSIGGLENTYYCNVKLPVKFQNPEDPTNTFDVTISFHPDSRVPNTTYFADGTLNLSTNTMFPEYDAILAAAETYVAATVDVAPSLALVDKIVGNCSSVGQLHRLIPDLFTILPDRFSRWVKDYQRKARLPLRWQFAEDPAHEQYHKLKKFQSDLSNGLLFESIHTEKNTDFSIR